MGGQARRRNEGRKRAREEMSQKTTAAVVKSLRVDTIKSGKRKKTGPDVWTHVSM